MNMRRTETRDQGSIGAALEALGQVWAERPDLSLGQLIAGSAMELGLNGLYYLGDAELIDLLRSKAKSL